MVAVDFESPVLGFLHGRVRKTFPNHRTQNRAFPGHGAAPSSKFD